MASTPGGARNTGGPGRAGPGAGGPPLHHEVHGDGAPILCIHGTGSSALAWAPAVPALARLGRVISYDRRGFARSRGADPPRPMSVADHTEDAVALLDALRAAPAVVIGRSYGGYVALDLALRRPGHVRALVLLEGAPESLDPGAERWLRDVVRRTLAAGEQSPAAAAETLLREVLGDDGWAGLSEETRRLVVGNGPGIVAELSGDYLPQIAASALAAIDRPTLVVTAEDSPAEFRRANEKLTAAIPGARAALVPGGHLVDPAGPAILAFIEEVLG